MATRINSLLFVFKILLLRNYRVKYYDYCKVVQWYSMRLEFIAGYCLKVRANLQGSSGRLTA